jgi:L-asparaginase II
MPTYLRSAAKPLQALPVIETGAADHFNFTDAELAVMSGSLNGEDFQVKAVRSILKKAGLFEGLLDCGVHRPSHRPTAKAMLAKGEKPLPIHNNCAGKHAAMLVICAHLGFSLEGYTEKGHPVQNLILKTVAQLSNYPEEQIGQGIDGCGVPVFRLPLHSLAGAYARLADPHKAGLSKERAKAVVRLMKACLEHPEMIAGNQRLCTRLMQACPNRFLAKTGTEGSYALAIPELGLGVAIQIEDGAMRALAPCVSEVLHQLGLLDQHILEGELKDLYQPVLKNHRSQEVAQLNPVFNLCPC